MEIGVRESRMIEGEYVLTQEDLMACTKFEDGVVCCNYGFMKNRDSLHRSGQRMVIVNIMRKTLKL